MCVVCVFAVCWLMLFDGVVGWLVGCWLVGWLVVCVCVCWLLVAVCLFVCSPFDVVFGCVSWLTVAVVCVLVWLRVRCACCVYLCVCLFVCLFVCFVDA